jgi:sugar phosphate isomerase/epimerase
MRDVLSRRRFLQVSSAAALAGAGIASSTVHPRSYIPGPFRGTLCLFSKSVPHLNWQELAISSKRAGFGGLDLTVRRDGHVMPARAAEDLPKAVAAIRAEGLEVPMITTELVRADDPTAEPIMSTASRLSIPYLKPGYYHYKFVDVRKEVEEAGVQFRGLAKLAEQYRVQLGFHNHAGYIGCQLWDFAPVIDSLDPRWVGYYYDLENAAEEGGAQGWRIDASLAMPRLKMLAAKDMYWKKTETEGWRATTCPLDEGMCNFKVLLRMAAEAGFHGPISLHMEYEIPGVSDEQGIALSRATDDALMAAAQRNLGTLKTLLHQAYEAG